MSNMTKKQKHHLQQLADYCYETEMALALEELNKSFEQWKNKALSTWELNEKIHQHHNGTARDLYKFYEFSNEPRIAVARGITRGIIKIEDVQEDSRELLQGLLDFYKDEN